MIFVRYIGIQILAYGIDMSVFLASIYLGSLGPIISNTLGKIAAGIFAFLAHRKFTFRLDRKKYNSIQVYRYFLMLGLNVPISAVVLSVVLLVNNNPVVAKFLSDVLIVLFTFWLSKSWVFSASNEDDNSSSNEDTVP